LIELADLDEIPIFACPEVEYQLKFLEFLGFENKEKISPKFATAFWPSIREPKGAHRKQSVFETKSLKNSLSESQTMTMAPSLSASIKLKDIQIEKELGSGFSGSVYQGIWLQTTPVAMKMFRDITHFFHEESLIR
jgi:hypothetical protein